MDYVESEGEIGDEFGAGDQEQECYYSVSTLLVGSRMETPISVSRMRCANE